jgi:hypothetical protein
MLSQDFKEFIDALNVREVKFLVIGGYAVAFHGFPRYTKDIDLWVDADEENISRLIKAISDFGLASLGLSAADFSDPKVVIQLGQPPNRIDLLCDVGGLSFAAAYERRATCMMGELAVPFIDLDDLISAKQAAGRLQDLADIENLRAIG